jgi:hypothetical protein
MKQICLPAALAAMLALAACGPLATLATTACSEQAKLPATVTVALDALDPHSTLGIYWANAKSACAAGVPVVTVTPEWREAMWKAVKGLAPSVIPWLMGLL